MMRFRPIFWLRWDCASPLRPARRPQQNAIASKEDLLVAAGF